MVVEGMAERSMFSTMLCQRRASLREIADTKMQVSAPATAQSLLMTED